VSLSCTSFSSRAIEASKTGGDDGAIGIMVAPVENGRQWRSHDRRTILWMWLMVGACRNFKLVLVIFMGVRIGKIPQARVSHGHFFRQEQQKSRLAPLDNREFCCSNGGERSFG
jgi:hypothetical protein